jgi:hypothetical protein
VALGPIGLAEALIVLGLILFQVRRFPERSGAYLVGMSIVPVILLGSIVLRMPACPASGACYAPITLPAIAGYAVAGIVGAILSAIALRRLYQSPQPSA